MKQFKNLKALNASQNFDPAAIKIEGVPEHHIEALKAVAQIFVGHDAVNPDFQPDFSDSSQYKWENVFLPGSPSGGGFRFDDSGRWYSISRVGARLVSESDDAAEHLAKLCHEAYKKLMVYQRPTAKK